MPPINREPSSSHGDDRFIPLPEVERLAGMKSSAIYARIQRGTFPEPIRLSKRCSRWRMSAVRTWMEDQTNQVPA